MCRSVFFLALLFILISAPLRAAESFGLLSPYDLEGLLDRTRRGTVVLDVRGSESYREGTIPGALDAGTDPAVFISDGRGGQAYLVTHENPDPAVIEAWSKVLIEAKFEVKLLDGGFPAWGGAGLSVVDPTSFQALPVQPAAALPNSVCATLELRKDDQ